MNERPLDGVQVLEICADLAGFAATSLLADLGAEVVQVTPPGPVLDRHDPVRVWADRHKTVGDPDLSSGRGVGTLRRMADRADVLVSDLAPGALERLGFDSVTALERNPDLVHVWMPPFGRHGRWSPLQADPLLLAAVSGFADLYPSSDDVPVAPVVPTFSYLHGALGATAAAAGLVGVGRGASSRAVTVSGLNATGAVLASVLVAGVDSDVTVAGGRGSKGPPFFRLYQGGDGEWLYLAALSPALFFLALEVLGRMDVMVRDDVGGEFSNLLRPEVTAAVNAALEGTFATRPAAEWISVLSEAGVPAAPVWTREQWISSSVASATTPFVTSLHPELGEVVCPASPIGLSWSDPVPISTQAALPGPDSLPLDGVRVLDISSFLAGPFAAALLADFGADVVKVEPLVGDPWRVYSIPHAVANQHKRTAALDLGRDSGRRPFLRLVGLADVMVDNWQESSLERIGLGQDVLAETNGRLVRCSVSAFGSGNEWSATPGFDPVLQAMTGLAEAQGGPSSPAPSGAPVVDVTAGTLGALGALAALYARQRRGHLLRVRTSLAAAAVYLQSAEMTSFRGRPPAAKGEDNFAGPAAWRRYYRTRDGWIAVAARTDAQKERFLELVSLRVDPGAGNGLSRRSIETLMAATTTIEWLDELGLVGIPAARLLTREVGVSDPYLSANGFSHLHDVAALGRFRVVRSYADWIGCRRPEGRPGGVGAHTTEILAEVGLTEADVSAG